MIRIEFQRLRFLVVDDNMHMRRIVRQLLHGPLPLLAKDREGEGDAIHLVGHASRVTEGGPSANPLSAPVP